MSGESNYSPYIIIGKLSRDFILTSEGNDINDLPGGHLLYAAIGMSPWERHPGLVARIGKNFPESFLELLEKYGYSSYGLKQTGLELDHRNFISFFERKSDSAKQTQQNVLSQYFKAGKPFPRALLGYNSRNNNDDSLTVRTPYTVLARDIPPEYLEARCVHLCPMDYLSHNLLPQAFSGMTRRTVTVQAGKGYMRPYFYDAVKTLVNGLSAFIVRERALQELFFEKRKISLLPDMMKTLLDFGAENIVVKANDCSYYFINRNDRLVKKLPSSVQGEFEKIGELSCFCGAYLVGLNETYDYVKAVCCGASRASLLQNDLNPFNNLHVFDGLVMEKARIMESKIEG